MNGGEIDKFPVSQLFGRYGLVRSAVYTRMDKLSIKPHKIGGRAYITGIELDLMDRLHRFINETGGSAAEFLEANGLNKGNRNEASGPGAGSELSFPGIGELGRFIAAAIVDGIARVQPEPDPMKSYMNLEEAARNGWELSTSDVAYLLDLAPLDIQQAGERFQDAGFTFTRVGYRRGGEAAWRVTKARRR